MTIQVPSPEQILDVAIDFGLDLSQEDARSFAGLIAGSVPSYNRLDELAEPSLPVKYPRTPGHRPARARPAGHADDSVPRHGDPARRLLARGLRGAGAQHGREHLPVRRSGHPAMTVPCAKVDDLPVGMMLIGRRFDEATVLRAAAAFEALGDGQSF